MQATTVPDLGTWPGDPGKLAQGVLEGVTHVWDRHSQSLQQAREDASLLLQQGRHEVLGLDLAVGGVVVAEQRRVEHR